MVLLRSILFTTLMFGWAAVCALLVTIFFVLPVRIRYQPALWFAYGSLWLARWLLGLRYRVTGLENIPDDAAVVLIKHSSAFEVLVGITLFPLQTWVVKRELMWLPSFGWGLASLKAISIKRGAGRSAVKQVIQQGEQRLSEGRNVVIFPEGTRVAADGDKRHGVSGYALASTAGVNIVPVAHNAVYFWPRRGWRKLPGTIDFVIAPPIDATGRDPRELSQQVKTWMDDTVAKLPSR